MDEWMDEEIDDGFIRVPSCWRSCGSCVADPLYLLHWIVEELRTGQSGFSQLGVRHFDRGDGRLHSKDGDVLEEQVLIVVSMGHRHIQDILEKDRQSVSQSLLSSPAS